MEPENSVEREGLLLKRRFAEGIRDANKAALTHDDPWDRFVAVVSQQNGGQFNPETILAKIVGGDDPEAALRAMFVKNPAIADPYAAACQASLDTAEAVIAGIDTDTPAP